MCKGDKSGKAKRKEGNLRSTRKSKAAGAGIRSDTGGKHVESIVSENSMQVDRGGSGVFRRIYHATRAP